MSVDMEIEVMQGMATLLDPLNVEARKRAVGGLAQKFGISELGSIAAHDDQAKRPQRSPGKKRRRRVSESASDAQQGESPSVPITDIVNLVRSSERAEMIEKYVL